MNSLDYLELQPMPDRVEELETPVPIIDIDVMERNVSRWQVRCDALGFANRPHIKTHKLIGLAKYQLAMGAKGITVQKLGEAEVMADAGITDMLLTFNIVGRSKLDRLAKLTQRTNIAVVADSQQVVEGLATAAKSAGRDIKVLVECDTGAARNGVQSPEDALILAQLIDKTAGLYFGGLMTYPAANQRTGSDQFLGATKHLCISSGLALETISSGGTPDMWKDEGLTCITEYRAGTYIYFDRSLVARGTCSYNDCALSVLTTIVSIPTLDRAIVDAGTKSLTSDLMGFSGYGVITNLEGAEIYQANEEHGFLDISQLGVKPRVGEVVKVTPNHVCPVSNLYDKVVFVRGQHVLGAANVSARGLVQ